ncbi:MAG: hypothetical protein KA015_02320 [Spirochaetes bacterium]|nr:hypothetical protein [Spirochaetota bacterium]
MKRVFVPCLMVFLSTGLIYSEETLTVGMFVAAQYSNGNWYTGKISKINGKEYTITYTDGDVSVVTKEKIRVFSKDIKLAKNERVLALYGSGQMYVGIVKSVEKNSALIKWEDGSGYANLEFDKIIKDIGSFKDVVTESPSVTIRKNGSIVGSIESDGTVRLNGSIVGKFELNGDIRQNGSIVGNISSGWEIRKNGSIVGSVDNDGTVRKNGSIIGKIDNDGTVRKNGSIIGSAPEGNKAQVAAYFFFFFLEE